MNNTEKNRPELTARHLIPFLGTGLEVMYNGEVWNLGGYDPFTVGKVFSIWQEAYLGEDRMDNEEYVRADQITPICRPFGDLVREIEHEGERFVPIVKLARLCLGEAYFWVDSVIKDYDGNATYETAWVISEEIYFCVCRDDFVIFSPDIGDVQIAWMVGNQVEAHDLLRQWHFPVGLPFGSYIEMEGEV